MLRLLAVSDEVQSQLLDPKTVAAKGHIDLVVGCGDLPADYLDCLAVTYRAPLLFVRGNHDPPARQGAYPEGAEIDGRLVRQKGFLIGGLEGCRRYNDGPHQYTEGRMLAKVLALRMRLRGRHLDVLITHGPPAGIHDGPDEAHRGLRAIRRAMAWTRPGLLLHGHVHPYSNLAVRESMVGTTRVINVASSRLIEMAGR